MVNFILILGVIDDPDIQTMATLKRFLEKKIINKKM